MRGVRAVATFAPQSNEILCIPAPAPNLSREQVIYFALPVNTPGIRMICRDPLGWSAAVASIIRSGGAL